MRWIQAVTSAAMVGIQPSSRRNPRIPIICNINRNEIASSASVTNVDKVHPWTKDSSQSITSFRLEDDPSSNVPTTFAMTQPLPLTLDLPKRLMQHPALQTFGQQGQVPLACIPCAIDASRIAAWKQDAVALKALGFGAAARVARPGPANTNDDCTTGSEIRTGVHQIWLSSPSSPSMMTMPNVLVGNLDARRDLQNFVEQLRTFFHCQSNQDQELLLGKPWNLPPHLVELSYLFYDGRSRAKYDRHVDTLQRNNNAGEQKHSERCISFVIYLGDGNQNDNAWYVDKENPDNGSVSTRRPWNCLCDGGALRIHGPACFATSLPVVVDGSTEHPCECWCDIVPEAGTLVLFESAKVEHQVLPTFRDRLCIVGWLGTPLSMDANVKEYRCTQ